MFTFFSMCAARYLRGETENVAMIISEEVTEPFAADLPFGMHNYRGVCTVSLSLFFFFAF